MRLWGVVVAVGLLVGCAVDPVDSGPVCPPGQVSRAGLLADEIKIKAIESTDSSPDHDGGRWIGLPLVFRTAQWAEMYPACFSDEARVRVYALRDRASQPSDDVAGRHVIWVNKDEYDPLVAALHSS